MRSSVPNPFFILRNGAVAIWVQFDTISFISRYTHYNGCGTPGGWHGRVLSEACASHQVHEVQVHPM